MSMSLLLDHAPDVIQDMVEHQRTSINASLWFIDEDGYRVVFLRHEPLYRVALEDQGHLRLVAVNLRQSELATQAEIAVAFGCSEKTLRRWERRYERQGAAGLLDRPRPGRNGQIRKSQEAFLRRWFEEGLTGEAMARRLSVSLATVRRALKRLGLKRKHTAQGGLAFEEDAAEDREIEAEGGEGQLLETEMSFQDVEEVADGERVVAPSGNGQSGADTNLGMGSALPGATCRELVVVGEPVSEQEAPYAAVTTRAETPLEGQLLPGSVTSDRHPADRAGDRVMARLGLLEDAAPLFADTEHLPRAGVLVAIALLVAQGVVEAFQRVYGTLGPAFYGLRTTVVTLFVCALLRIKRPENLKEHRPWELGRVLGLDRAPEVKTLRRKVSFLAGRGQGQELMEELARGRIREQEERIAFLYIDGHVREYYGQYPLAKAKKSQRQVAQPATTDTWVHDAQGEPLLVVTGELNEGLTQVLEPILQDVRRLVASERRITVVFDRGGFSAKLFARLVDAGFDIITYRKGKVREVPSSRFQAASLAVEGKAYTYQVHDQLRVRVGRLRSKGKRKKTANGPQYLWMRQVTVLRSDGRQTRILTTRLDLGPAEVCYRMFHRWRQENYFKYMMMEFDLDGLVEYGAQDVSSEATRPNPEHKKLRRQLQAAREAVRRLEAELGEALTNNEESDRPTIRGFKIAHAALRRQLEEACLEVEALAQQLKSIPKRIPAADLQRLRPERKRIVDCIKMAAYQIETKLLRMLQGTYARIDDEGRTFLHAVFQSPARLEVADGELRVTLAAQSSPHRTACLAQLCEQLDTLGSRFPGSALRLRFAVEPHSPDIS